MTDTDFVLSVLRQRPATAQEIYAMSMAERHCGLTPHTRISEARQRVAAEGLDIVKEPVKVNGRTQWRYTLEPTALFSREVA